MLNRYWKPVTISSSIYLLLAPTTIFFPRHDDPEKLYNQEKIKSPSKVSYVCQPDTSGAFSLAELPLIIETALAIDRNTSIHDKAEILKASRFICKGLHL